jgi:hypothetical protein
MSHAGRPVCWATSCTATVIDLATRMVVGWQLAAHMRTSLVIDALAMAITHGHVGPGAIFHSDRGAPNILLPRSPASAPVIVVKGKTHAEAMRCLRRRLTDHVWRSMITDERSQAAGPGGHSGATLTSSAADLIPTANPSEKSLPGPTTNKPTTPPEPPA